jgi:hypothetical protein
MIKETIFEVPKIRVASKIEMNESTCYLFEMEHNRHTETTLMDIFDLTMNQWHWDKFITPGSTAVDIGTHIGDTTIAMQFLSRGVVLGIEPNPMIKAYLDLNANVNSHLGKFVTASEAVTTADVDEVIILDHNNELCNGGLIDPTWTPAVQQRMRSIAGQSITTPGLTLEHLCQKYLTEEEINNISFIKTDTEGHDVSIIQSSKDFINRIKPVLFIEWFFAFTEVENTHMFEVIEDLGYKAFDPYTLQPADINNVISDLLLIHSDKVNQYL